MPAYKLQFCLLCWFLCKMGRQRSWEVYTSCMALYVTFPNASYYCVCSFLPSSIKKMRCDAYVCVCLCAYGNNNNHMIFQIFFFCIAPLYCYYPTLSLFTFTHTHAITGNSRSLWFSYVVILVTRSFLFCLFFFVFFCLLFVVVGIYSSTPLHLS